MIVAAGTPGVVWLVVGVCLSLSASCFLVSFVLILGDAAKSVRNAAAGAAKAKTPPKPGDAVAASQASVDFGGIAEVADSLVKLNAPGRLLVIGLTMAALAAATATVVMGVQAAA